jgi:hypothetical protein
MLIHAYPFCRCQPNCSAASGTSVFPNTRNLTDSTGCFVISQGTPTCYSYFSSLLTAFLQAALSYLEVHQHATLISPPSWLLSYRWHFNSAWWFITCVSHTNFALSMYCLML